MSISEDPNNFSPDFAAPADWAAFYRSFNIQVVPSHMPDTGSNWKRPAFAWKEFADADAPVPQAVFDKWFGRGGSYAGKPNMGILTGKASGGLFILDLDDHKGTSADTWWRAQLAEHNSNSEPETAQQVTGGGGRQLMFRAPAGWKAPTNRTAIGVDIRGEGGFAVLPPSLHSSGNTYAWKPGCGPWECEIAEAPRWLCEAIDTLVERHGTAPDGERTVRTASPAGDFNAFGVRVDGREDYMRGLIWANLLDLYNQSPIPLDNKSNRAAMFAVFEVYLRNVKPRLTGDDSAEDRLEREGRGITAFSEKWANAVRKWDGAIARDAKLKAARENKPVAEPEPPQLDAAGKPLPLVLTPAQFMAGFTPPEYLWDGIMQRGYLYALTGRTGHGKTAVVMQFGLHIAGGVPFHGATVKHGTVLLLAGENPDDVRARFIVACHANGIDPTTVKMRFVAGVVDIAASMPEIRKSADEIADLVLVIVDTAAAYFKGDDSNSNSQQGDYARVLRSLSFLPGKPAVLVNCHPVKNAAKDNLLPMGGSSFLNEIDGNLTLWAGAEKQTTLHWQGKFRGPEFEPLTFEIVTVTSPDVTDAKGRLMPSVIARPATQMQVENAESKEDREVRAVLNYIARNPRPSIQRVSDSCNLSGKPRAQRIIASLVADKLCEKTVNKVSITKKGKSYIGWDD